MKRSEINKLQREAVEFFAEQNFHLPKWAYWTAEEWEQNRNNASEIIENKLGWDITDFNLGDFYTHGLLLFTLRNGNVRDPKGKTYAEKIMIVRESQITPWHFHWQKAEDIINRGGGNLIIELCNSNQKEQLDTTDVTVQIDGVTHTVKANAKVVLTPGESICLPQYLYHKFYGEKNKGWVLVGEVSQVNDDDKDNRFLNPLDRFSQIVEDETPLYYLCNEYPF